MPLEIGKLRHRITLQYPADDGSDGMGGTEYIWTDVDTVWAAVEPKYVREVLASGAVNLIQRHEITIREREVQTTWRVVMDGRYFYIQGIMRPQEYKEYLVLTTQEGLGDGVSRG